MKLENVIGYAPTDADRERIIVYCQRFRFTIVDWLETKDELERFLATYPQDGDIPIDFMMLSSPKTMTNDIKDYMYEQFRLARKGVMLMSVVPDFWVEESLVKEFSALVTHMAHRDRVDLANKPGSTKDERARAGIYVGGRPPMGYKVVDGKLVVVEEEAEVVRKAFRMLEKDKLSVYETARRLNRLGYSPRRGVKFTGSSIMSLQRNRPLYRGFYRFGTHMRWNKGQHESILGSEFD